MAKKKIELTEDTKIKVYNNSFGSSSFFDFNGRKYYFPKYLSWVKIPLGVIEYLYSISRASIEDGYFLLSEEVYKYLDIPKEIYKNILTKSDIEKLLQEDDKELAKKLDNLSKNTKENIAKVAKSKKIDSLKKREVIEEKTGLILDEDK